MKKFLPYLIVLILLNIYEINSQFSSSQLLLHSPQRWVDTSEIPLTPYEDGWIEFNGIGSMIHTAHSSFFDIVYSATDSFRIVVETGFTTPKRNMYVCGNYDAVSPNWCITWWSNFPGQYEFFIYGLSTRFPIAPVSEFDTSFHTIEVRWKRAESTLKTYKDGELVYTYTNIVYNVSPSNFDYALCIGNRTEFQNQNTYGAAFSGGNYMFRGKIRQFLFAKNDSSLCYKFNGPNSQQVCPVLRTGGAVSFPYYPYEYADRHGTHQSYPAFNFFMNNGVSHGIDTMDVKFIRNGVKEGFKNDFSNMSSISGFRLGVWIESYGGQLLKINGELYAAGDFNTANGFSAFENDHDSAKGVVRWDGEKWIQLGYGLKHSGGTGVMHIFAHGNDIIATGYFTEAVGVGPARYVSAFDLTSGNWRPMGYGFNNAAFCGASAFGKAFVGGFFTQADQQPCLKIAQWNGSSWQGLAGGLDGVPVYIQEKLWGSEKGILIGGYFTEAYNVNGTLPCPGIVFWSIDSLKFKLYKGLTTSSGAVYKILQHNGWEYFIGDFPSMNGTMSYGICRYGEQTGVQSIGTGIDMQLGSKAITGAEIIDGKLYIGGQFSRFNGMLSHMVSGFDLNTGEVIDMGYGLDMRVEDMIEFEGDLVILGDNFMANGNDNFIVTRFETGALYGINNQSQSTANEYILEQNFPNPFNPETKIVFSLKRSARVTLEIYDVLGREVITPIKDKLYNTGFHSYEFNFQGMPSGVYFYSLSVEGQKVDTRKMVLVK